MVDAIQSNMVVRNQYNGRPISKEASDYLYGKENVECLLSASVNPKTVTEGVNEMTKFINSLTALVGAGLTFKEAIKVLFPKSNPKELQQLEDTVKDYNKLSVVA